MSGHFSRRWNDADDRPRTDLDAIAVTAGPGLIGSLLVGVLRGQGDRLATRSPAARRQPSRGSHPLGVHRAPRDRAFPRWPWSSRAGTPRSISALQEGVYRTVWHGPATTRPERRSTRSRSCWDSGIPAEVRSSTGSAQDGRRDRASVFPPGADEGPLARLLVQRAQERPCAAPRNDEGLDTRHRPSGGEISQAASGILVASFQKAAVRVTGESDGTRSVAGKASRTVLVTGGVACNPTLARASSTDRRRSRGRADGSTSHRRATRRTTRQ